MAGITDKPGDGKWSVFAEDERVRQTLEKLGFLSLIGVPYEFELAQQIMRALNRLQEKYKGKPLENIPQLATPKNALRVLLNL